MTASRSGPGSGRSWQLTGHVPHGYPAALVALAVLWGSGYMLVDVAVRDLSPAAVTSLRLAVAAPLLLGVALWRIGGSEMLAQARPVWKPLLLITFTNSILPFWALAWGQERVDSGVAAIASASIPIFVAILALRMHREERTTPGRFAGLAIGLLGIGVLTGVHPQGGSRALIGTLAVLLSALLYAFGYLYTQARLSAVKPEAIAAITVLIATVVMAPIGVLAWPDQAPSTESVLSAAVNGFAVTGFAGWLLWLMIARYGSTRVSIVTYVSPPIALGFGAVLLDETITPQAIVALVLILMGVALGSGMLGARRQRAEVPDVDADPSTTCRRCADGAAA